MWTYKQSSGLLSRDGAPMAFGYSGCGEGKNNAALQQVHDLGPIPRGRWHVGDPECITHAGPHGPFVLPLTPREGTETYNRSGFLCHGDSVQHVGQASHGCLIFPRYVREEIAATHDQELEVIA